MATPANSTALAAQARRVYCDRLLDALSTTGKAIEEAGRRLLTQPVEHETLYRRRDALADYQRLGSAWLAALAAALRSATTYGVSASRPGDLPVRGREAALSLVDDDTIEREILGSRLALAIMDRASWEFADLRSRMSSLEKREELDTHDLLRAHVLARLVVDAWRGAGLSLDAWRALQPALHDELTLLVEEAYHETNRWLVQHRVLADIDLRPFIRRSRGVAPGLSPVSPARARCRRRRRRRWWRRRRGQ